MLPLACSSFLWFAGALGVPLDPVRAPVHGAGGEQSDESIEQHLARAFPTADSFAIRVATLTETQRAGLVPRLRSRKAPRLWTYREARQGERLLGRAVVDDVIGKSLPITYLVVFEADNRVRSIEILEYRESHGGEVRREKWRAQFAGKRPGDGLRIGTDIKNIAGATLSCRALTDGVHDALAIAGVVFAAPRADVPGTSTPVPAGAAGDLEPGHFGRTQLLMGTLLELRASGIDRARFDAAADAAFARVAALEACWSTWRADSEVSLVHAALPGAWCALSPASVQLFRRAAELRAATGGAFAVESGALVGLWREAAAQGREPEPAAIEAARRASRSEAFEWDLTSARVRRKEALAKLDLGALGKGAALDAAALELRARGVERALLDFGGQLLALDGPRAGAGWPVLVRDPRGAGDGTLWELELERGSLATSADDQRGLVLGARRVSHVVDPRSGHPAESAWTACAFASNATDADAWSTAAFVLGPEAAAELSANQAVRILVLGRDGRMWTSAGFPGRESRR